MATVMDLYTQLSRLPQGRRVFSLLFSRKAPYFATVRPRFTDLRPDHAELVVRNRRRVRNHLGTVHVIAICNGLEAAMGALAEVSVPADKRWIPQGMEVAYPALATGDITCIAETDRAQWAGDDPDLPVRVRAVRAEGVVVVEGVIRLWVTPRAVRSGSGTAAGAAQG